MFYSHKTRRNPMKVGSEDLDGRLRTTTILQYHSVYYYYKWREKELCSPGDPPEGDLGKERSLGFWTWILEKRKLFFDLKTKTTSVKSHVDGWEVPHVVTCCYMGKSRLAAPEGTNGRGKIVQRWTCFISCQSAIGIFLTQRPRANSLTC